jgi:cyanophycinase-like exopeptidase
MCGPDQRRAAPIIAERLSQLSDQILYVLFLDDLPFPDLIEQLLFRHDRRAVIDQHFQQSERLGREVNLRAVAQELAALGVEDEIAES